MHDLVWLKTLESKHNKRIIFWHGTGIQWVLGKWSPGTGNRVTASMEGAEVTFFLHLEMALLQMWLCSSLMYDLEEWAGHRVCFKKRHSLFNKKTKNRALIHDFASGFSLPGEPPMREESFLGAQLDTWCEDNCGASALPVGNFWLLEDSGGLCTSLAKMQVPFHTSWFSSYLVDSCLDKHGNDESQHASEWFIPKFENKNSQDHRQIYLQSTK